MRPFHYLAGLVVLGLGLAGWATLGSAQTRPADRPTVLPDPAMPDRPAKGESRPIKAPRTPTDEPFIEPVPPIRKPAVKPDADGVKRADAKNTSTGDVKPTVFIPTPAPPPADDVKSTGVLVARQEPAICLEWFGPTALKVGAPAEYTLSATNTSGISLHKVIVQIKVPAGAKVAGTEPQAEANEDVLLWELGTLTSRQDKSVKMKLVPPGKGELLCQAWVTFTGSSAMKVMVREPKLEVSAAVPEKVSLGDPASIVLTVGNPGDHPAEGVKLAIRLGDGLECAGGAKSTVDVGTVPPGQTRQVTLPCVARAAGKQKCDVTAEGDGLKACSASTILVVQPRLELEMTGPKLRYLDRKAAYSVKVTNPGDATATDVNVTEHVPAGFKFVSAEAGGKYDASTRTVHWMVGELAAGKSSELKWELMATGTGAQTSKVVAGAAGGLKAEKSLSTTVEGLSALAMEVTDTDDPVEVGAETSYEIRIMNTGSKDETDVKLVCTIPPQMKFKIAAGPVKYDVVAGEVVFHLPKLEAKSDATFKVTVTAMVKGDARFKATLTATGLSEPVVKQESTRLYAD
jgi:Domain of unknown function DUF11